MSTQPKALTLSKVALLALACICISLAVALVSTPNARAGVYYKVEITNLTQKGSPRTINTHQSHDTR